MSELNQTQPDLRFAINGIYSHYRKEFYQWEHDNYRIGDPVGTVRIRKHSYNDNTHNNLTGYTYKEPTATYEPSGQPPSSPAITY